MRSFPRLRQVPVAMDKLEEIFSAMEMTQVLGGSTKEIFLKESKLPSFVGKTGFSPVSLFVIT
jgi:hypothetical protein